VHRDSLRLQWQPMADEKALAEELRTPERSEQAAATAKGSLVARVARREPSSGHTIMHAAGTVNHRDCATCRAGGGASLAPGRV
jgi:hypothetical protein